MAFFAATALGPHNPAFRGRQAEFTRLVQLCRGDVTSYIVVYGGRQNGKTSLLLQLEAQLSVPIQVCRVDFQQIQGASAERTFAFLSRQIAQALPLAPDPTGIADGPGLTEFLTQALARPEITRLVLLLDELGALPAPTRESLANALRSLFHTRLVRPALSKLQIVFSGGIELYNLVMTEVSSLYNICEELHLGDLSRRDAVALLGDGLRKLGYSDEQATSIGEATYVRISGHPYLTQRIGTLLEGYHQDGATVSLDDVERAVRQLKGGDPLLRRIRDDLREHQLESAARRLLSNPTHFTRLDDELAKLELIGFAKEVDGHWVVRNSLLADVFSERLGVASPTQPTSEPGIRARLMRASIPENPTDTPAQTAIITAKQRRLDALRLTAARYGIDCPPHITVEIEDLQHEIAELSRQSADPTRTQASAPTDLPVERTTGSIVPQGATSAAQDSSISAEGDLIRASDPSTHLTPVATQARVQPLEENRSMARAARHTRPFGRSYQVWLGIVGVVVLGITIVGLVRFGLLGSGQPLVPTASSLVDASKATPTLASITKLPITPTISPIDPTATSDPTAPAMPTSTLPPALIPTLTEVPEGPFLMGSNTKGPGGDETPQHSLSLPTYWIGKTEVTVAQFRPFVEGDGYTNRKYWTAAGWAWRQSKPTIKPERWDEAQLNKVDHPVVGITWFEAVAYCRWLSDKTGRKFRLPTEAEWEKAARGTNGPIWPWGNNWARGHSNSSETDIGATTSVGNYPSGASPYGALDMIGNVAEWCSTKRGKYTPQSPLRVEWEDAYLEANNHPILRGGSWAVLGQIWTAASRDDKMSSNTADDSIGLRVVSSDPPPDS